MKSDWKKDNLMSNKSLHLGLKLGSRDTRYTDEIIRYHADGIFQYIELFAIPGTYDETIDYWEKIVAEHRIPFGIHAAHSAAGLNPSEKESRESNKPKIEEAYRFADSLNARYVIFHPGLSKSGLKGRCEETIRQLLPYADERTLVENKPRKGLDGSDCIGSTFEELKKIIDGIGRNVGFCLDFGHAVCAANTYKIEPLAYIKKLMELKPRLFHLTDGDVKSELDSHLHYGAGTFPLKELLSLVPDGGMVTNEAKRTVVNSLTEFFDDSKKFFDLG